MGALHIWIDNLWRERVQLVPLPSKWEILRSEHNMNTANRRQFIVEAAGLGCTALAAASPLVNTLAAPDDSSDTAAQVSGKSLLAKMK
jgi:hypothetical protein